MDQQITALLNRLAPIQKKLSKDTFSNAEYKELALTMGLSEWDWQQFINGIRTCCFSAS